VSPRIVETVRAICLAQDWVLDHVIDAGDGGSSDTHWITRFAKTGGQAILSADTDFALKPPQVIAVFRTGLKVMLLPPQWGSARDFLQAAHILLWWPRIEVQLEAMRPRECFRPEWNVGDKTGKFHKIDINFHRAQKKLKRSIKRRERDE
jgi:hypothetical protein